MAPSINWATKIITIPQADLTFISGSLYELDVNDFRLDLKSIEDDVEGMAFPATHRHNTQVVLAGVTYARVFEIINGYTVTFQNTGTPYIVRAVGANHNLGDVTNFDGSVSLVVGNAAGLLVSGSGVTQQDKEDIIDILEARQYDGRAFQDILPDLLAMAAGKIVEVAAGVYNFYERDNSTIRYALTKAGNERTRS